MDDHAAAPFLFSENSISVEKVGDPIYSGSGVSTGDRLLAQRPDVYKSIVYLLSQATGIREIKRITGVHHRTIEQVAMREGQTIDTLRREIGARALRVASMGVERLEEIVTGDAPVKAGELAMVVGVLTDKAQLLTGGVTQRVERVEPQQIHGAILDMIEAMPLADAQVVPGTGCGPEETSPTALDLVPIETVSAATDDDLDALLRGQIDSRSTALPVPTSVEAVHATPYATPTAPIEPDSDLDQAADPEAPQGGRGVDSGLGPTAATNQSTQKFYDNATEPNATTDPEVSGPPRRKKAPGRNPRQKKRGGA